MSQRNAVAARDSGVQIEIESGAAVRRSGPQTHLLTYGSFYSLITATGAGWVGYDGLGLNRFVPDPTTEDQGIFLYLRDVEEERWWSPTLQPGGLAPDDYLVRFGPSFARFERSQGDLRSAMEVTIHASGHGELRRLSLQNTGERARTLEVTSFIEIVLNDPESDLAHPAFSKLFIQTSHDPNQHLIRAWRRKRSSDDRGALLAHFVMGDGEDAGFETSRFLFLGRGRSLRNPRALSAQVALSGTTGSVLDPIASLRRRVEIDPGQSVELTFVVCAARDERELDEAVRRIQADPSGSSSAGGETDEDAPLPPYLEHALASLAPEETSGEPDGEPRYRRAVEPSVKGSRRRDRLQFDNGVGGFSRSGNEYVIRLTPESDGSLLLPPHPWTNVIANDRLGFLVSETGAACTWSRNSRENRLSPWYNDVVSDPHGEAVYLRDEDNGIFWSALPGPAPAPTSYEVRHGLGYTAFHHRYEGLEVSATQFVQADRPAKLTRIVLQNKTDRSRAFSLFAYLEPVLGSRSDLTRARRTVMWSDGLQSAVVRHQDGTEYANRLLFSTVRGPGSIHGTSDRTAFIGRLGDVTEPRALRQTESLAFPIDPPSDPCVALQRRFEIAAGESVELAWIVGDVDSIREADELLSRLPSPQSWSAALDEVRAYWKELTTRLQISTPAPEIDLMVNSWLPYQNLSCRMRGRSAFYQSGGAFGFRDQLQDAAGLLYLDPGITRRQILLHASRQFVEGDVMHWWHPPTGKGIRTRFSDDLLWLPYVTAHYIGATGDRAILREIVPYLTARHLEPGEDEAFLEPEVAGSSGDLFEHCCRAIDRSLGLGSHGLPLMGTGDWNDGMNRVGREGRGESVWLGFFLLHILNRFIPICSFRGELDHSDRYDEHRARLREALNAAGWDGAWYRRAFYDNGDLLGSSQSEECRIDALAQAWAVISGAASPERGEMALQAMDHHLVDEEAGVFRLLTPAFDQTRNDPGYIKGYVPGVRENGGQYTHGVLWGIRALAEANHGDRATAILRMLSPVSHAKDAQGVERYRVEPYVVAADVYGEPPHVGHGGWTWYTGSAAWMYRVAVESILGFRLEGGTTIVIDPSIDASWTEFSVTYRLPDHPTVYELRISNPDGQCRGVSRVVHDGADIPVTGRIGRVPIDRDGRTHVVEVTM